MAFPLIMKVGTSQSINTCDLVTSGNPFSYQISVVTESSRCCLLINHFEIEAVMSLELIVSHTKRLMCIFYILKTISLTGFLFNTMNFFFPFKNCLEDGIYPFPESAKGIHGTKKEEQLL